MPSKPSPDTEYFADHGLLCAGFCDAIRGVEAGLILFHNLRTNADNPTSMNLINAHTHSQCPDAIVSVTPGEILMDGYHYSVGIHPWTLDKPFDIKALDAVSTDSRVVAIGETGLDTLASAPLTLQGHVFRLHTDLSERLKKPLIIHCVRAHEQLLAIKRDLRPAQPWIFHGFRLKPTIARRLLDAGLYLSLGSRFNSESARLIPSDRLLLETDDDSDTDIRTVAAAVAAARNQSADEIIAIASANLQNLISQPRQGRSGFHLTGRG